MASFLAADLTNTLMRNYARPTLRIFQGQYSQVMQEKHSISRCQMLSSNQIAHPLVNLMKGKQYSADFFANFRDILSQIFQCLAFRVIAFVLQALANLIEQYTFTWTLIAAN